MAVFISFTAAFFAMSASVVITDVPWLKFVSYPSAFAGREALLRGLCWFSMWCLLSNAFGIGVAWLITSSDGAVNALYRAINKPEDAHAGLATVTLVSWGLYVGVVLRTCHLADLYRRKIPDSNSEALGSFVYGFDYGTIFQIYKESDRHKWFIFTLKLLLDVAPLFLVPFYLYFYRSYGMLLKGCITILLEQYGEATIVEFYKSHRKIPIDQISEDSPQLKKLDQIVGSCSSNQECAPLILNAKIKVRGYVCVKDYIANFVKTRARMKMPRERMHRQNKRYIYGGWYKVKNRCPHIRCENNGKTVKGAIVDCSVDGSGLYIRTRTVLEDINEEVNIYIKTLGQTVRGIVIHTEATYRNKNIVSGYGVRVNEGDRGIVTALLPVETRE